MPHKAKFNTARIPACICGGLTKDCVFSNIRTGLEELLQWMKELQQEHAKSDLLFGTRAYRMRVVT
ncbi:hypothetical protein BK146_03145 [Paenibacillus sp. FSL R7-0333]|nr:hypothetical protein BK146_03145 [Paenibacillus sp. FSL R7-0333]